MMILKQSRKSLCLRSIAFFVCLVFSFTTITWAADGAAPLPLILGNPLLSRGEISPDILIPADLGRITKSHKGKRKETVIHIQDAHLNEDAQRHIAGILQYLKQNHDVGWIGLEGASGRVAHHLLSAFPNPQARELVADYFLRKGFISGPEFLAISRYPELVLYGVENDRAYQENREVFLNALEFKKRDEKVLADLRKILERLVPLIFSQKLQKLTRERRAFEKDENNLATYLSYLVAEARRLRILGDFSSVERFLNLLEAHLDWGEIQKESDQLAAHLKEKLSGGALAHFIQRNVDFNAGKTKSSDYYAYLQTLLSKTRLAQGFSHLENYFQYLASYESIDISIFDEIDSFHDRVKESLFQTPDEIKVDRLFKALQICEKIFEFALTEKDANYFYKHRPQFLAKTIEDSLFPLLEKYPVDEKPEKNFLASLDEDLPKIERFYEIALRRDRILIANTLSGMKQDRQKISVLITGGFHTPGIERFLQEQGYSYLVVTPRMTQVTDENKDRENYIAAMRAKPGYWASRLSEYSLSAQSPFLNDPRFQLQTPRLLPTLQLLETVKIPGQNQGDFDFPQGIIKYPSLSFVTEAAMVLGLTDIRLGFSSGPARVEEISRKLSSAEKPWGQFLYSLIYRPRSSVIRDPARRSGMFLSEKWGPAGVSIKSYWYPTPQRKRMEVAGLARSEVRVETKDGYTLEVRLLESVERSLAQTEVDKLKNIAQSPKLKIVPPPAEQLFPLIPWDRIPQEDQQLFVTKLEKVSFDFIVLRRAYAQRFRFPSMSRDYSMYEIFQQAKITPELTRQNPIRSSVQWVSEDSRWWGGKEGEKKKVRIYRFVYSYPEGRTFTLDLAVTGFETGRLVGKLRIHRPLKLKQQKPADWETKKIESQLEVLRTGLERLKSFEMSLRQKRLSKMQALTQSIRELDMETAQLKTQIQTQEETLERLRKNSPQIFKRKQESKSAKIKELGIQLQEKIERLGKLKKELGRQRQLLQHRKARIEKLEQQYQSLKEGSGIPEEPVEKKKPDTVAEMSFETKAEINIEKKEDEIEKAQTDSSPDQPETPKEARDEESSEESSEWDLQLDVLKKNPEGARTFIEQHGVDTVKKMIAGLLGKTEGEVEEELQARVHSQAQEEASAQSIPLPVTPAPAKGQGPKPPLFSIFSITSLGFLISLGVLLSDPTFLLGGVLVLAGFQAGKIAALFVNEWSHILAAVFLGYPKNALTWKNLTGRIPLKNWLGGFFSFQLLNPSVKIYEATGWRHTFIRHAGWIGSLGLTAAALSFTLFYFPYLKGPFSLAAVVGLFAGITAVFFRALSSDFFGKSQKGIYCCGNEGGALATEEASDAEWFNDLIEKMTEVQVVRGEQAGGQVGYMSFGDENNLTSFRARIVKSKRGKLPKALRKAADKALRWAGWFKRLRYPEVIRVHAHTRYGTSSRPSMVETQPHMGLPEREVSVWVVEKGKFARRNRKLATYVSHNGNFEFWEQFNQNIPFQLIRDEWVEKILGGRNPAVGDTPRVSELMDVLFNQGMPDASFLYAFTFVVIKSVKDAIPSQAVFSHWEKLFDPVFRQWISEQNSRVLTSISEVTNHEMRNLANRLLTVMEKDSLFQEWIPSDKRQHYMRETVKAFFKHDLNHAVRLFRERAKGSFGLVVTSTLEPNKIIIAANAQPMSIGFHPDLNLVLWSSESAALKVPFKARGKKTSIPYRYDLNQETGEVAELTVVPQGLPKLKIYSEEKKWELDEKEVVQSGRVIDMRDNPLIEKLPEFHKEDLVGADIREMAHVLDQIRRNWQDAKSFNRQTGEAFLRFLLEKDIQKRIENKLNRKRSPAVLEKTIHEKSVFLAHLLLNGQFPEESLEQEIRKSSAELLKAVNALESNLGVNEEKWTNEEIPDVVITGIEVSQWLGEQFAADLKRFFPALKVESVSSNKILQGLENAYFKNGRRDFTVQENNRTIRINQNTLVLAISQSGQTFPTLNATIVLNRILKGRVFALTGGLDTLMGKAVGQVYAQGAPFSARIFDNLSGLRPAEPSSVASAATHATLTELLLYLGGRMRQLHIRQNPLGMVFEKEDLEQLQYLRDDVIREAIPSMTGFAANPGHDKIESPVNKELLRLAKRWSQHILEYAVVTAIVALVVSTFVYFGVPFFPSQFAWFPRPSWLTELPALGDIFSAAPLVSSVLDAGWFVPLGAVYFILFSYPFTLGLRMLQRRFPLLQRTGKRTLVIGALPYVHQLLEAYVSKLFSLSYGFATVDVHGANARDHMIARFGHRIVRGLLSLLLKPDGRVKGLARAEGTVDMTHSQMEGVENFKVGTEVFTIGRNPRSRPSTAGGHLVLPEHRTSVRISYQSFLAKVGKELELSPEQTAKLEKIFSNLDHLYEGIPLRRAGEKIGDSIGLMGETLEKFEEAFLKFSERQFQMEQFYDARFDSFEGLISGYVLFWAIAKKVARFFRWVFLTFDIAASQSRTRVATTRMPERAPDMAEIARHFGKEEVPEDKMPVISIKTLPFQIVTSSDGNNREGPLLSPQKELAEILLTEMARLQREQGLPSKNGLRLPSQAEKTKSRSELRADRMGEALKAKQEFEFQNFKLAALKSVQYARAMKMEEHLHEVLASFGSNEEVLSSLGINRPASAGTKGYYFLDFKPEYKMALIQQLLNRRPENVTLVIFAEEAQREFLEKTFASETKENMVMLPKAQFADFIQEKLKELHLQPSAVTYLRTSTTADELKEYEADALLGLVRLAQGGIVGAASRPVPGARELNLYQVITAAFKAARLIAKSA